MSNIYEIIDLCVTKCPCGFQRGDIECEDWSQENRLEIALEELVTFRKLADLCQDKERLR